MCRSHKAGKGMILLNFSKKAALKEGAWIDDDRAKGLSDSMWHSLSLLEVAKPACLAKLSWRYWVLCA